MKLVVDRDLCEANGVCVRLAPAAFELDDEEVLHLRVVVPHDDAEHSRIDTAIAGCPKAALSWEES